MDDLLLGIGALLCAAFVGAVAISAHRFERKQQREGKWDANGPIHPTDPPPGWGARSWNWLRPPAAIETDVPEAEREAAWIKAWPLMGWRSPTEDEDDDLEEEKPRSLR